MDVLIVDHLYPEFVRWLYAGRPDLKHQPFAVQRSVIAEALFSEVPYEVEALRKQGHNADYHWVNASELNAAWAKENGIHLRSRQRPTLRLRRGWLPWPSLGAAAGSTDEALLRRVAFARPEVVHIQCVDRVASAAVLQLRGFAQLVTGQIAAPIPDWVQLQNYDLMISSLPNFVSAFRQQGLDAEWLPLAFEPRVIERVGTYERDVNVSFVGSLSTAHRDRVALLVSVANAAPLDVWSADKPSLPRGMEPTKWRAHGPAWGLSMYRVLARSRITINSHIDIASGFANNLRLYEATGMGALLVTERSPNLSDLFVDGREVVTYATKDECRAVLQHYLQHPVDALAIARAGQARTLRDHTWAARMEVLADVVGSRLRAKRP